MAKNGDEKYGKVLREFEPLASNDTSTIRVRALETERARVLDVRVHVATDSYEGPTKKGIRLTLEAFEKLMAQADEIRKVLAAAAKKNGRKAA